MNSVQKYRVHSIFVVIAIGFAMSYPAALFAEENPDLFQSDMLFVEIGGGGGRTRPGAVTTEKNLFYYDLFRRSANYQNSNALAYWLTLKEHDDPVPLEIYSHGRLMTEFALNDYVGIGGSYNHHRFEMEDVPVLNTWNRDLLLLSYLYLSSRPTTGGLSPSDSQLLDIMYLSSIWKVRKRMFSSHNLNAEVSLHFSVRSFDVYARIGASILSDTPEGRAFHSSGMLGFRYRLFADLYLGLEGYGNEWHVSFDGEPGFSRLVHEYGGRFMIGWRLPPP